MAAYENLNQIKDHSPNMLKCDASIKSDSFAVSNEIYGALILEPTIPSVISDYEEVSDIDMPLPTVYANTKSIAKLHQPSAQSKKDREELLVPADVSVENLSYYQLTKPISSTKHIVYEASEPNVLCVKPLSEENQQTVNNGVNDLPSITPVPFVGEGFNNLDDFWLDLAKGQAIRSNIYQDEPLINREMNPSRNKSFVSESNWHFSQTLPSNSIRKSESDLSDGFVRETCWTYSQGTTSNSLNSSNEFPEKNDFLIQLDFDQEQDNDQRQSSGIPESRMSIGESLYELARPETYLKKQTHMGDKKGSNPSLEKDEPSVIRRNCLTRKFYTLQNGIYELSNPQKDLDEFRTASLDRAHENKAFLQTLQDNQLYESVDNLSERSQLPVPSDLTGSTTKSTCSKTLNSKGYYKTEEPVYATVVKPITRRTDANVIKMDSNKLDESAEATNTTENDEFFSLASSRITTNTKIQKSERPDSGLGLDYTYAKISKPKRYENWPLTKSLKKRVENSGSLADESGAHTIDFVSTDINSDYATLESTFSDIGTNEIQCGAVCTEVDLEDYDHYSTIEEIERQRNKQIHDKTTSEKPPILTKSEKSKITLKTRMKGLITKVTKIQPSPHQHQKSVFYPFSFIYNFPITINGMRSASVKTILPNVNGKCWIICKNDLKIRMYDSQGSETESIYIGLEGEDMAYDNKGFLYVSCKDTRRIFKIDTRNLCQISAFVDCDFFPLGLAFDILDNTLIVCQNPQTFDISIGVASVDCIKKYSVSETLDVRNLTHEILFSHPHRVIKNSNTDIVVSDPETKSITMLNQNGEQKIRFSGNDIFKMECHHTFICDLQANTLIYSQNISKPSNKNLDNVCLLDQSGDFIDTFNIEEVQEKTVNSLAITDLGFLWIGCDEGIFIFDYQII